ncbi:MAG: tetratricopeptide repeat protein, partial [Gammaproteobacteria bacterium]
RQSLGDDPGNPRYIEGVRGEGYRLAPEVRTRSSPTPGGAPEKASPRGLVTGRKLDFTIIALLLFALGYFAWDKFATGKQDGQQDVASATTGTKGVLDADTPPAAIEPSIAVLPFVNMSDDAGNEYFSEGISEEVLNLLAKIPELKVISRSSAFTFKDQQVDIPTVAEKLGVAHVLGGSVRKAGDRVRVTVQLIYAADGVHLWSETYDRQLDDVFQIQDDIAGAVVDALRIQLLGETPRARRTDTAAYQAFLEGQYLKRQLSIDSLNQAVEAFKRVVAIDPDYAPAWAELADTYFWGGSGLEPISHQERAALANEAIDKAISLDPDYAYAYYVRGVSGFYSTHQFEQGMEDFRHALELDPDNAILIAAIGKGALLSGNYELAISRYEAALAVESLVPEFYRFVGMAYLSAGRLGDAEKSFRTLALLSPDYDWQWYLWQALFLQGDLEDALELSGRDFQRAAVYHALGETEKAEENLARVLEDAVPYTAAMAYGLRGEADKAFEWLDKQDFDDFFPPHILCEAAFLGLHSDPRWPALLEKVDLLDVWRENSGSR